MKWSERQIEMYQQDYNHLDAAALAVELADERQILEDMNHPDSGADFAEISDQEHRVEALRRLLRTESE